MSPWLSPCQQGCRNGDSLMRLHWLSAGIDDLQLRARVPQLIQVTLATMTMDHGRLLLKRSAVPIHEPVTKFGGLPVWVGEPAWPTSAATGAPMLFIGQVVLNSPLFPVDEPRIAYLFISADNDSSWDPNSGENAVIIQKMEDKEGRTRPTIGATGPRLEETYWERGVAKSRPLELSAEVVVEPMRRVLESEIAQWDEQRRIEYFAERGQAIGGEPHWIQADECPEGWRLLLQMSDYPWVDGEALETNWNFGTGSCYVLVSPDFSKGILLWQC